jgi:type VI secretion system protein ImpG
MHWSLISSMNLNYLSLLDREALIQVMRTFDLPGTHHPQQARLSSQKLDAIEKSTLVRLTACLKVFRFGACHHAG